MNEQTSIGDETVAIGAGQKLRERAAGLAGMAKRQVSQQYQERIGGVAQEVQSLAGALREASQKLNEGEAASRLGALALDQAARQLENLGRSMDGKDLDDLVAGIERIARRNPAAFLGTAAAIGFLGARFLKSTSRARSEGGQL